MESSILLATPLMNTLHSLRTVGFALLVLFVSERALAAPKWYVTESEGFTTFSNASKTTTKRIVEDFMDARRILKQLYPSLVGYRKIPMRIVICNDQKTVSLFSPLYDGKPKKMGGVFMNDLEGPIIVVCVSDDLEYTRQTVYHEYIHYLTRNPTYHLPDWLNEGLADLFSTIDTNRKGKVEVGNVRQSRINSLQDIKFIPLERLFQVSHASPEYNSEKHGQGAFYAQSWLLLHYLHFGENDFPPNSLGRIINHAVAGKHFDEAAIQEILGVDLETLTKQLKRYQKVGRFTKYIYTLEDNGEEKTVELRLASEGEVNLMIGALVLHTRSPRDAYSYLENANQQLPDSSLAAAYQGYHALRQDQKERALENFERSISYGCESPFTYLHYANTKLDLSTRGNILKGSLTKQETLELLTLYFKARELAGGFAPQLYYGIGRTWLCSSVDPTESHMKVLVEGMQAYPDDERIAYYMAIYLYRNKDYDNALALIDRYNSGELSGQSLHNYKSLRSSIESDRAATGQ